MPGRQLQSVVGVVQADVSAVWEALLATVVPGMSAAGAVIAQDADRAVLSVSGHWWFHAEYRVSAHERGSRIVYTAFNVAPALTRWLVPLVAGAALHASQRPMVEGQIAAIASRLGVPGYLTD